MKKQFSFEFEDGSAKATGARSDGMATSYSGDELIKVFQGPEGVPFISGNGPGLIKLGEMLIQIGMSEYLNGFHVHVYEDFDADKSQALIVGISNPT